MDFKIFKAAVAKQFERMSAYPLFRTGVEKDALWDAYLAAFPEGTNPMFRKRTEHDCSCCKSFIRAIGNVVTIIDGRVVSIWDGVIDDPVYGAVSAALAALVKSQPIADTFLHFEPTAGADRTLVDSLDGVSSWSHFFVHLPRQYVRKSSEIASAIGETRAHHDVLARSLETITGDAIETVLDLVAQNALYRGAENQATLAKFKRVKAEYDGIAAAERHAFVWACLGDLPGSVSKIRNTSIGTLLVDLSEGRDLDEAVRAFEIMVAGPNYKRPAALVTKAMVEKARKTIEDLGLSSALERRYAVIEDVSINDVLFADRRTLADLKGDVFSDLAGSVAVSPKSFDKVQDVTIDKFISDILPRAESLELMVENRHLGNLVSLVAPADPTAKQLFKWNNLFSWSYNGDMADSMKERVKRAGGNVTGDLCCRLAWEYSDDLDFHMREPGGAEIYYGQRRSRCGGELDVDANGQDGIREHPVENIFYADRRRMAAGIYELFVENYSRRSDGVGFEAEIEFDGQIHRMTFEKVLRTRDRVVVAKIRYSDSGIFEIVESLPSTQTPRQAWGMTTQTFRPVNAVMLSPNYWGERGSGNKHWFFMLQGCRNDGQARGFFNEFLIEELSPHRKVIEMVGARMKTDTSDRQLSGLGFSSTQRNSVLCRVGGSFSRVINLVF